MTKEEILTIEEAAALLLMSAATLRRLVRAGDIPSYRLGPGKRASIRFHRSEVVRYAKEKQGREINGGDLPALVPALI